jgi:outer membrane protein TolC
MKLLRSHLALIPVVAFASAGTLSGQVAAAAPAVRSLSLLEALEIAERESETVAIARAEVARTEGDRRRARSGYYPQLSGSAEYDRTLRSQFSAFRNTEDTTSNKVPVECARFVPRPDLPIAQRLDSLEAAVECSSNADPFASFRNLPFGRENTYRFGLSASQTLFSGGRVSGQAQAAGAGVRGAELGLTAARAQLLLDVTQAYYDAALGDRLVGIAEATLTQADTTLTQTQLARQVGNQSEFDLLRARVTRDNQRPVVIQRRADRDLAYYRLKQILNLPLDHPVALSTELGDTALVQAPQMSLLVENPGDTAAESRAPVRQAAAALEGQRGLLRAARAQHLPQVTLSSQFAELGYPGDGSPFGTGYLSDWTVSLVLQLPIFTGGRIRGDVEVARASMRQAELRLQQTRELAEVDARNSRIQLESAVAAWEASQGTVEQAARAYDIADLRYREGMSTQTELNDVRIQLEQAQASRARAARDLQVAKIRLALLPALPLAGSTAQAASPAGTVGGSSQAPSPATPAPAPAATSSLTSATQSGAVRP